MDNTHFLSLDMSDSNLETASEIWKHVIELIEKYGGKIDMTLTSHDMLKLSFIISDDHIDEIFGYVSSYSFIRVYK
ncbi:MAG: hypothetical protein IKO44_01605 [Ruminococcus sp.]|nr:hypothetical protein [Ruminococcus sp.]